MHFFTCKLTCCLQRDDDLLPGDDDSTKPLSTRRSGNGSARRSVTVERQALISEHLTGIQSFTASYDLNPQDVLGSGRYGTVRKARLKRFPTIVRAVKELRKCPKRAKHIRQEVIILRNLDHPNVCKLFETFEDQNHVYLVLELITGRPLLDELEDNIRLGHFDERWTKTVMRQIFDALRYCHHQGVLHNDLKLENVMVDKVKGEPHITLIDFGLAGLSEQKETRYKTKILMGTRDYMAPEVIKSAQYSTASDMWSAGIILFLLYMGGFPDLKEKQNQIETIDNLDARELLSCILQVDPSLRMSANEALEHPWTRGMGGNCRHGEQTEDLQKAMKSFLDFYKCSKLQKAALTAAASQLCGQQLEDMRKLFQQLDCDGNGVVTKGELVALFEANPLPSIKDTSLLIHEIFDELDSDGSGELEFTELQAAVMRSYVGISEEAMQAAFHALDVDNSGTISQDELGRVVRASKEELLSYMRQADLNGDGVLDFEEFKAIFTSLSVASDGLASNSLNHTLSPSAKTPGALTEENLASAYRATVTQDSATIPFLPPPSPHRPPAPAA